MGVFDAYVGVDKSAEKYIFSPSGIDMSEKTIRLGAYHMLQELFGTYTVEYNHTKVGQLTVSEQGLMTRFACECVVATAEVLRLAVLVGTRYVVLGVLFPDGDKLRFTKQYSKNDLRLKGLSSIDACRLVSRHDTFATDPVPASHAETERFIMGASAPGPLSEPEPVWEPARNISDDKVLYTHTAKITVDEPSTRTEGTNETPKAVHPPESNLEPAPEPKIELRPEPTPEPKPEPTPKPRPEPTSEPGPEPTPEPLPVKWTPHPDPGILFTDPDLVSASAYLKGTMTRPCGNDCIELAVPFEYGKPFPLLPIFCFGTAVEIDDRAYLVFRIKNGNLIK